MNLPVYRCFKTERELRLTGKLDDPLWGKAAVIKLVRTDTGGEPRFPTDVRLLYSDTMLYVGFHCVDDYVWGTRTKHDSDIFNEECVEVFISPAGTAHQYYEINVSPKNVVFDACILSARITPGVRTFFTVLTCYNPAGLKTIIHVKGELDKPGKAEYWNAEYAIPLNQLFGASHIPPRPGDKWRMNLYRIDYPKGDKQEFYAWNPTEILDFHLPWRFGVLQFE